MMFGAHLDVNRRWCGCQGASSPNIILSMTEYLSLVIEIGSMDM